MKPERSSNPAVFPAAGRTPSRARTGTARVLLIVFVLAAAWPVPLPGRSLDWPDTVVLDSLTDLYEGAEFDHLMHVELADDCTVCHHHTVGIPSSDENCVRCHDLESEVRTVACGDCHLKDPFSASSIRIKESDPGRYHLDKPGLKAAYHLNCLGCHKQWGAPTDCEDCHLRTEAGNLFYRSGAYAPAGAGSAPGH